MREVIAWSNSNRGTFLKKYDWQMDTAASVHLGYGVTVITATSDGKSFCYQLIAMPEVERTMLVICPLIALMVEQVLNNGKLGIKPNLYPDLGSITCVLLVASENVRFDVGTCYSFHCGSTTFLYCYCHPLCST